MYSVMPYIALILSCHVFRTVIISDWYKHITCLYRVMRTRYVEDLTFVNKYIFKPIVNIINICSDVFHREYSVLMSCIFR